LRACPEDKMENKAKLQKLAGSVAKRSDAWTDAYNLACMINGAMKEQGIPNDHYEEIESMVDIIHDSE